MTQLISIHPVNPQARLIEQVIDVLQQGGVIVYPTDSAYALGCRLGDKNALERIKQLRNLDKNYNFTLVCQNLSELGTYARVDNPVFRMLKANTPGSYTFILPASHEVPKRLQHAKRKTIGLRVPDHPIALALLKALGEPIMSVTLFSPGKDILITDPEEMYARLEGKVDIVVDGGFCGAESTTVIDLTSGVPEIIRVGKGNPAPFQ